MPLDTSYKENVRHKNCGSKPLELALLIYNSSSMDLMVLNKFCVLLEDRAKAYWNRLKFAYIMLFSSSVMQCSGI